MIDICEVLYRNGYQSVTLGSLMRLIGVENEAAMKYDDEVYSLGENFEMILDLRAKGMLDKPEPGTLLH